MDTRRSRCTATSGSADAQISRRRLAVARRAGARRARGLRPGRGRQLGLRGGGGGGGGEGGGSYGVGGGSGGSTSPWTFLVVALEPRPGPDEDHDGLIDICEYRTLARSGDGRIGWRLMSIEQQEEGAHHLDAAIVTAPWSDDARLSGETVVELATADAPRPETGISELVSVEFEGHRAREGAGPLARRSALRARGARGRRAARRRGMGRGRRRRRRGAARDRHAGGGARAAVSRRRRAAGVVVRGPRLERLAITPCTRTASSRGWRSRRTCSAGATSRTATRPPCCPETGRRTQVHRALDVCPGRLCGGAVAPDLRRLAKRLAPRSGRGSFIACPNQRRRSDHSRRL
jgi:hypothetical protein